MQSEWKPRVTVYVTMSNGTCRVSGIWRYPVPMLMWNDLFVGVPLGECRQ